MAVISVYKNPGEGLNELLLRVRTEKNLLPNEPLTYAGRLDPLAEGVVVVLSGEDRFEKEKYLGLDKEYEVSVLFGADTDTLDPLGIVQQVTPSAVSEEKLVHVLTSVKKKTKWKYPAFSSKTFEGKALFARTRSGEVTPDLYKEGHIYEATLVQVSTISSGDLLLHVKEKIGRVKGDFRQIESLTSWQEKLSSVGNQTFYLVDISVRASSGVYMREFARWLGENLGTCAIAYTIKRTKVGDYQLY